MNGNQKTYSAPTLASTGSVVDQTLGSINGRVVEPDQTGMWPVYQAAVV